MSVVEPQDDDDKPARQHEFQPEPAGWTGTLVAWWWEIGSAALAVLSMITILIVLTRVDNMALAQWLLPIQPNSLISIFTTIGKSALMVPIASCLSQLAWQHFAPKPQSLDHLRVFDDASRGPWGAMELLFVIGKQAYLARLLAIATVLALAIEPFAQQILEFRTRNAELAVPAVEIGSATDFQSMSFSSDAIRDNDLEQLKRKLVLDNDVANAILGVKSQPYFHCPPVAGNCTFPQFTTLGVCGTVENRTESATLRCERGIAGDTTCTFSWDQTSMSLTFNRLRNPRNTTSGRQHDVFFLRIEPDTNNTANSNGLTMTAMRARSHDVSSSTLANRFPPVELLRLNWFWCAQTYSWTNVTGAALVPGPLTTERLAAKGSSNGWVTFSPSSNSKLQYRVHAKTDVAVWDYLGKTLSSHVLMDTGTSNDAAETHIGTETGRCRSYLEMFLYTADLRNVTGNVADMLSHYVRSGKNANQKGDNVAGVSVRGSAWVDETYIEVRWGWLSLPLGETLLAVVLLWATVVSARRSGVPVLGSSPLGLLFHGLDGDQRVKETRPKSRRRMANAARGIEVQFTERGHGGLAFVAAEGKGREEGLSDKCTIHETAACKL